MGATVVEVLHEFAQLTILAAAGRKGVSNILNYSFCPFTLLGFNLFLQQEHLVDRAMGSGFEHIAMFFFNYFNNPSVSEIYEQSCRQLQQQYTFLFGLSLSLSLSHDLCVSL